MNDKERLRNELYDLKIKLILTKDVMVKNEINEKIKKVKKAHSGILLKEMQNIRRKEDNND